LCSALYCVIYALTLPAALRPLVRGIRARCALPNQFRCQTSKPCRVIEKARPEAVKKPARSVTKDCPACLQIGVTIKMAAIWKQRMSSGGAERDRTADLMLAKHALSQLSYSPTSGACGKRWWAWVESNYRPHPYQGCALTN
jgi:hypothetical protein